MDKKSLMKLAEKMQAMKPDNLKKLAKMSKEAAKRQRKKRK